MSTTSADKAVPAVAPASRTADLPDSDDPPTIKIELKMTTSTCDLQNLLHPGGHTKVFTSYLSSYDPKNFTPIAAFSDANLTVHDANKPIAYDTQNIAHTGEKQVTLAADAQPLRKLRSLK